MLWFPSACLLSKCFTDGFSAAELGSTPGSWVLLHRYLNAELRLSARLGFRSTGIPMTEQACVSSLNNTTRAASQLTGVLHDHRTSLQVQAWIDTINEDEVSPVAVGLKCFQSNGTELG